MTDWKRILISNKWQTVTLNIKVAKLIDALVLVCSTCKTGTFAYKVLHFIDQLTSFRLCKSQGSFRRV
jgi:hypothetical protein